MVCICLTRLVVAVGALLQSSPALAWAHSYCTYLLVADAKQRGRETARRNGFEVGSNSPGLVRLKGLSPLSHVPRGHEQPSNADICRGVLPVTRELLAIEALLRRKKQGYGADANK